MALKKKAIDKLTIWSAILPKSKLGKTISYLINQWPSLETYLDALLPSNWAAANRAAHPAIKSGRPQVA